MDTQDVERLIQAAYRDVLLRSADAAGISLYARAELGYDALSERLSSSKEYRDKIAPLVERIEATNRPRVLIFGAYGNGNLGDDIQAASVEALIKRASSGASIWSTSLFTHDYPMSEGRKLPHGTIYSNMILDLFDFLVIGGGGLLAHPHDPLGDEGWCNRLNIPVAIIGVGAEGSFVAKASSLLKKASFVGARDVASISAILPFTPHVSFVPDPVLLAQQLPTSNAGATKEYRRCWILRDPIDDHMEKVRRLISDEDIVIGVEPGSDEKLLEFFPEMKLIRSIDEFWTSALSAESIISMRYHGVILGLIAGIDTYSYRIGKGAALLRLLGLGNKIVADIEKFSTTPKIDRSAFQVQREEMAALYVKYLRATLERAVK